jgi:hypothetical protein
MMTISVTPDDFAVAAPHKKMNIGFGWAHMARTCKPLPSSQRCSAFQAGGSPSTDHTMNQDQTSA